MSKQLTAFISTSFLLSIAIKAIDCFKSPDSVQKYLHFSSNLLINIVFLLLIFIRVSKHAHMSKAMSFSASFVVGPAILVLSILLTIINFHTNVNFIYSKTQINTDQLYLLGTFVVASGLISLPSWVLKKYYKKIIFWSAIAFVVLMHFYGMLPFSAREEIVKEDGLIENVQFLTLIIGAIFSFLIGRTLFKKQILLGLLFCTMSLALLLVAGDEISWGQRIFHIATPTYMQASNNQNEITVHNDHSLSLYVPVAYMIVGLYGSFAWLALKSIKRPLKGPIIYFIPGGYLFPYFFFGFFYNFIAQFHLPKIGIWSEPAELMLYSGVMFFFLGIFYLPSDKSR